MTEPINKLSVPVPISQASNNITSESDANPSLIVAVTENKPIFTHPGVIAGPASIGIPIATGPSTKGIGLGSGVKDDPLAAPLKPTDPIGGTQGKKLTKETRGALLLNIAEHLMKQLHFARDKSKTLFVYERGVFRPSAEDLINRAVKKALEQRNILSRWDAGMCTWIVNFLLVDCPLIPEVPQSDMVNVRNGMLDIKSNTLLPHDPKYLSYIQLPISFDPEASSTPWDEFIQQVFPNDCWELAYEIMGWFIRPLTFIQSAVCLVGEGSNGKSTFLTGLKELLGDSNYSTTALHTLQNNRFAGYNLMGKLANICSDLPDKRLEDSDVFKALTGNDGLDVEIKHGERFHLKTFARLVFSANNPPSSRDASYAYFRRWIIVPFPRQFVAGQKGVKSPDQIAKELFNPVAMSGLFNRALEASRTLEARQRFLTPQSSMDALNELIDVSSPLHLWAEECLDTTDETKVAPIDSVLRSYNQWRKRNGYGQQGVVASIFGKELRRFLGSDPEKVRRGPKDNQKWCFKGMELKDSQMLELVTGMTIGQ